MGNSVLKRSTEWWGSVLGPSALGSACQTCGMEGHAAGLGTRCLSLSCSEGGPSWLPSPLVPSAQRDAMMCDGFL